MTGSEAERRAKDKSGARLRRLEPEVVTSIEPQQQLEFLSKIQRLLGEGQFTATYKYALLLAIADICVEDGEDSAAPFEIFHVEDCREVYQLLLAPGPALRGESVAPEY